MFFARILRFSLLMGTSQIVQTLAGFARNKLIAVIVGPSGVGLMGLFSTFSQNLSTLCGCGIGVAGVRLVTSAPPDERPSKYASVRQLGTMLGWPWSRRSWPSFPTPGSHSAPTVTTP